MSKFPNRSNTRKLSGADALDMRDTIARLREEKTELLAALEATIECFDDLNMIIAINGKAVRRSDVALDAARAAITKAKGGAT